VKCFALEDEEVASFERVNRDYLDKSLALARLRGSMGPMMQSLSAIGIVIIFLYGGHLMITGEIEPEGFETVGGYLLSHVGRVPAVGERFDLDGLNVEVLESERRRINKVRISKLSPSEVAEDAEAKSRPV